MADMLMYMIASKVVQLRKDGIVEIGGVGGEQCNRIHCGK